MAKRCFGRCGRLSIERMLTIEGYWAGQRRNFNCRVEWSPWNAVGKYVWRVYGKHAVHTGSSVTLVRALANISHIVEMLRPG